MTNRNRQVLHWAPRVLSILFAAFIALFALDAVDEGVVAVLRHLIPSFVLLAMAAVAWRWEWVGALICGSLLALFLWWNYTVRHNVFIAVLTIAGPLAAMMVLYLIGWIRRREVRGG